MLTRSTAPWPVRNCRCLVPAGDGDTMLASTPLRPTTFSRPSLVPSCRQQQSRSERPRRGSNCQAYSLLCQHRVRTATYDKVMMS